MSSSSSPGNDDMVSGSQTSSPISESPQSPMIPSEENQSNSSSSPINSEQVEADDGGKSRLKSAMWNHYDRIQVDGVYRAVCHYCSKSLGGETKNGTKHLHDHFRRCPKRKYKDIVDMRQQVLVNQQNKADERMSLTAHHFDQEVSKRELAIMIILHEYPLSVVEHFGFRRFVASLQPLFKMVCRNTIKSEIFKIYNCEKENVMRKLDKNRGRVAITTDMWTSSNKKRGFMVVTAHFVDDSWNLHSRVMRYILLFFLYYIRLFELNY